MSTPFQQFWTQSYIWIKLSKLMEMEIQWMLIWSLSLLGKILEYHYQMPLVWSKSIITKIVTTKARSYFHKLFSIQNICQTIIILGFCGPQKYFFFLFFHIGFDVKTRSKLTPLQLELVKHQQILRLLLLNGTRSSNSVTLSQK